MEKLSLRRSARKDSELIEKLVYEYSRSASSAISEFAPNNSFYAGGRKLNIDQIDLTTAKIDKSMFKDEELADVDGVDYIIRVECSGKNYLADRNILEDISAGFNLIGLFLCIDKHKLCADVAHDRC